MSKKSRLFCAVVALMTGLTLQAKTFREVRAAAEQGDADAQFELALYHSVGICVKRDAAEEEKWFRKAAEQGHVAARATCLSEGYGVKKDIAKAVDWLRKAAETGDVWSQLCLGIQYAADDNKQSLHWFRKAAEQGNGWAQVALGLAYLGIPMKVPRDPEQAFFWLKKAAEQGNAMGQMLLAGCYTGGTGVPKDREKAIYWLRQAADQGCEQAKESLKKLGQ